MLRRLDALQCPHELREVFNALRWMVHSGCSWSSLPTNFPLCEAGYQQTRRWIAAEVLEDMTHDLRDRLRWSAGRETTPSAVGLDTTTRLSTLESGTWAGHDGYKMK